MPETPDAEASVPPPPDALRTEATRFLRSLADGDRTHLGRLFDLLHEELRHLAGHYLSQERANHTLQPTALLNEAYLRLIEQRETWRNRGHFLGIAAQAMGRILTDHARGVNRIALVEDPPLRLALQAREEPLERDLPLRAPHDVLLGKGRGAEARALVGGVQGAGQGLEVARPSGGELGEVAETLLNGSRRCGTQR